MLAVHISTSISEHQYGRLVDLDGQRCLTGNVFCGLDVSKTITGQGVVDVRLLARREAALELRKSISL